MSRDLTHAAGWPVGAAAERVGVSVSTLRSWESRYGLAPCGRTAGGHRRYTAADVSRLQRLHRLVQNGLPTAVAAATVQAAPKRERNRTSVERRDSRHLAERLQAAIDAFDSGAAERLAARLLAEQGTVGAWTEVFTPVLQSLGRRWQTTGGGVECEHLGTDLIGAALADHRHRQRTASATPGGGPVLAAAPGEGHTLPLRALAAALAEHGIASTVFDCMPVDALRTAIERSHPAGVVVFARSRDTADTRALRRLRGAVPLLCAGGTGWPARLPADVIRVPDLRSAVDVIRAASGPAAVNG